MEFLHTEFWGGSECTALVTLDAQCNVLLLEDSAWLAYKNGGAFTYYGGWATQSPVRLTPPHHGHWHVVIDLGGRAGRVGASVRIIGRNNAMVP